MRTNLTIIGHGDRKQGVAKTGKAYDFTEIAFSYTDYRISHGEKAFTSLVNSTMLPPERIKLGAQYEAFIHEFQGKVIIDGII